MHWEEHKKHGGDANETDTSDDDNDDDNDDDIKPGPSKKRGLSPSVLSDSSEMTKKD